nr:EOG090X07HN [Polyphemus pediculus]
MGCLVVGAEACNPEKFTKQYCQIFADSGLMPKKRLARFMVTPDAALLPTTPLNAGHFIVGQAVDVYGKTTDYGFQGVVKRWGFKGGPASHGATKFHRRGGTVGTGRDKARVWPGTKMPGHMGSERRYNRGLKIMRINMKYNVIYVKGTVLHRRGGTVGTGRDKARVWPGTKMPGHMGSERRYNRGLKIMRINMKYNVIYVKGTVPGPVNSIVQIFDTKLPLRRLKEAPPHPTYFPPEDGMPSDDIFDSSLHTFGSPSISV